MDPPTEAIEPEQITENQVQILKGINDQLLAEASITAEIHAKNKDALVKAFVEGEPVPKLTGMNPKKATSTKSRRADAPSGRRYSLSTSELPSDRSHSQARRPSEIAVEKVVLSPRLKRGNSDSDLSKTPKRDVSQKKRSRDKGTPEQKTEALVQDALVPHPNWFLEITGCDEKSFIKTKDRSFIEPKDSYGMDVKKYGTFLELKNQLTDKTTVCGQFKLHMYGDLLLSLGFGKAEMKNQIGRTPCAFEIVSRFDDESLRFVDVAYLQTLPENHNAVFQIASNFNGVEAINELSPPDREKFTENYYHDRTQGPAASISAGSGAIARVHAAYYNSKKSHTTWNQSASHQINFVSDKKLLKHFPITNGYVIYGNEKKFPKEGTKKAKKLLASYLVAYHRGQQVIYGHRTPNHFEICKDPNQRVDQVCCAAVNMLQGRTGIQNKSFDPNRVKMQFILQAVYNSTYMSAIHNGREKIFLTLVGGGAFGNELPAILRAILNAHLEWSKHSQSNLKKVVLVLWQPKKEVETWMADLVKSSVPVSYIIYSKGVPEIQHIPGIKLN